MNKRVDNKSRKLSLRRLLLANPWGFMIPLLLGGGASLAGVALLGISGWFICAAGLATASGLALVFNYLTPGAIVRFMAILRTSGRYGEQVSAHHHLLGLLRTLRLWVWDQRVAQDPVNLHRQSRGDLLQRLVSDLDQIIRWPLVVFLPWIYALSGYVALSILAYYITPALLLPLLVAGLLHLLLVPYLCGRLASHAVHVGQILGGHRRSRFISVFSALITLTIRGHWQAYAQRLKQLDERQYQMEVGIQQAISVGRLLAYLITIGLLVSSFYLLTESTSVAGYWHLTDGVQGTWVVAFVLSVLAINELVLSLSQCFVAQGQSQVGLRRLNQLHQIALVKPADTSEVIRRVALKNWRGFHAPSGMGHQVIDCAFDVGDKVWIRGASGSGKSTLLASLAGDCLATGQAFVNQQIQDLYANQSYQAQLSYLPQSPYIFQQSIAANLLLGDAKATDEQLWEVLDAVALGDWARNLPNQLNTLLSSQGRDLSGGQVKRLALARLLLRRSPILLLDEPFDGLDTQTIECIYHSLEGGFKPSILIFISHVGSRLGDNAKVITL